MSEWLTVLGMEGNPLLLLCVLFPFAGGMAAYGVGRRSPQAGMFTAAGIALGEFLLFLYLFLYVPNVETVTFGWHSFCQTGMYFRLDGFRLIYGLLSGFVWLVTMVFSAEYMAHDNRRNRFALFMLFTLGATVGVFLSAELFTTFLFFELMSFTSYVWVVQEETPAALRAGGTYLGIAVIGGLVLLMGLFLLRAMAGGGTDGRLWIEELRMLVWTRSDLRLLWPAGLCLLFGFGAKAGVFPLHIWLPEAHPAAPAPASALLSGILTKAGIFGILIVSCQMFWHDGAWGTLIVSLGVVTMVWGAVLALLSVNLKRTLACSSLSQTGFIWVGVGMAGLLGDENILAVRGVLLHMVNHSLFKLVLFLTAGVVFMNVHQLELNRIRGFGRNKPLLHLIFLSGALGIAGVPFFSGYVSKTLLHESIVAYGELLESGLYQALFYSRGQITVIEWLFLISGGLTAAYMTKLYVCIFVEKNSDDMVQETYDCRKGSYMNKCSALALTGSALAVVVLGIVPHLTMDVLADMGQGFMGVTERIPTVHYLSVKNLTGAAVSLLIGAALYLLVVRRLLMRPSGVGREYCNRLREDAGLENLLYRPLLLKILPFFGSVVCRTADWLIDGLILLLRRSVLRDSPLPYELPEGTPVTHLLGCAMDHVQYGLQRLRSVGKERKPSYHRRWEHKLAALHSAVSEYNTMISRSMSFGLLLFCIGFLMTVLYLLLYFDLA